MELTAVVKNTAAKAVANQILEMIRQGAIRPGDQLPIEKELGQSLCVGRSTIREALQILATLNIIRAAPGQGTFVQEPTTADILRSDLVGFMIGNAMTLDLLEAREMIEPPLTRFACIRGTEDDFAKIEDLLATHEKALRRAQSVSKYAARFHLLMAEASHNSVGTIFMSSILDLLTSRGRTLDRMPDYLERELAEHRELLRLVRAREPDLAADYMLKHIITSATTYTAVNTRELQPVRSEPA